MRISRRKLFIATAALLFCGLFFYYLAHEGMGLGGGLWWKERKASWRLLHDDLRLLIGSSPTGISRPLAVSWRNSGTKDLIAPFARLDNIDRWTNYSKLVEQVVAVAQSDREKAVLLSEWISANFQLGTTLSGGSKIDERPWHMMYGIGYGSCNDTAYLLVSAAQAAGLQARRMSLDDHIVVEIYYDEGWHLFDPFYQFSFYDRTGTVPSLEQLQKSPDMLTENTRNRPWFWWRMVKNVFSNQSQPMPTEITWNWDAPPVVVQLRPSESWTIRYVRQRELFIGKRENDLAYVGRGFFDLIVQNRAESVELPFQMLRGWLVGKEKPNQEISIQLDEQPVSTVKNKWEKTDHGWVLPLFDLRSQSKPTYRMMVDIGALDPASLRLQIEAACAANWLFAPRPGLSSFRAGWQDGEEAELTLWWRQK